MDNKTYNVGLTIGHRGKGIPYGGNGVAREDGTANHGFKDLKGKLHLLSLVPELTNDSALHHLIDAINQPASGLVSVGCGSWPVEEEGKHRWSGYVEFAINTAEAISDARNYFYLFFHFDKLLHDSNFERNVKYHWQLEGAHFWQSGADGFTCTIWIYTDFTPSFEDAKEAWEQAVEPLIPFLGGYPIQVGRSLFSVDAGIDQK